MKFITLALVGLATAQDESISNCTTDLECEETDEGEAQRCATMTMEGFSVDQCVAEILCGETMELEGVEMSYNCFDNAKKGTGAIKIFASVSALFALAYAM